MALVVGLLAGGLISRLGAYLNHDTAWYLHAGALYLDGARLYEETFVEVNPPLGFFLTLPGVILARASGLFVFDAFAVYVYLLVALSLASAGWLLRRAQDVPLVMRRGLLLLAAVVLTLTPANQFGQREHLMMALVLPYLLLCALRPTSAPVPWAAALAVGLAAGFGFAVKPHYLLVPGALELYRLIIMRRPKALFRPETLGLAAAVSAYVAAVALLTPEYMTRVLPYALEVYNQAFRNPLWINLWRIETVMLPVGCIVHFGTRRDQEAPQFGDVFFIAALAYFAAYLAQMKGWYYHLYPMSSALILGYFAVFLNALEAPWRTAEPAGERRLTRGIALASLALVVALVGHHAWRYHYRNLFTDTLLPYVERQAAGGSIAILTSNVWPGFPLVNWAGVGWSSRFPTLWMLPGAVRRRASGEAGDPALLQQIEGYLRDAVVADFAAAPPDLVIVDIREKKSYFGEVPFDYLDYFLADPRFARIWAEYEWFANVLDDRYGLYRRRCRSAC